MARRGAQGVPRALRTLPKPQVASQPAETIKVNLAVALILDGQVISRQVITIETPRDVGPEESRGAVIPLDARKVMAALEPHLGPASSAKRPALWLPGMGNGHPV